MGDWRGALQIYYERGQDKQDSCAIPAAECYKLLLFHLAFFHYSAGFLHTLGYFIQVYSAHQAFAADQHKQPLLIYKVSAQRTQTGSSVIAPALYIQTFFVQLYMRDLFIRSATAS